jgi:multidrug efflux pump subunit AcrA (membrane-fusion protein)
VKTMDRLMKAADMSASGPEHSAAPPGGTHTTAEMMKATAVILLTVAGLALAGCSKEPASKDPVVKVEAVAAKKVTLQRTVSAEAVLSPIQQAEITAKINAPVQRVLVQRGAQVKKDQLLVVLENRDLAAAQLENKGAYEQAEAAYANAVSGALPEEWKKAELDLQAAKQTLDAQQKLYDSRTTLYREGALPRKDFDQAEVAYVQARNQYELAHKHLEALQAGGKQRALKAATGQLASAKGKFLGSEAQLSYSEIRSPINGVIADRPVYVGEMASSSKPLVTVMDVSQVVARAHIPQDDAALVKLNDPVTFTAVGSEEKIPGKVTVVSPALDPNSTTVEVWVQAANPGDRLRPGSSVHLTINVGALRDAVVVPASALLNGANGKTEVMTVGPDGRAHETEVQVGVRQEGEVQIVAGVRPGQQVITTGAYGLPDNTQVQVSSGEQRGENQPIQGKNVKRLTNGD